MEPVPCDVPIFGYTNLQGQHLKLQRTQHPSFGVEIRALLASSMVADKELTGIVLDEIDALCEAKRELKMRPNERRLKGDDLDEIGYIRLYTAGRSARIYFTVMRDTIWMLALDPNKRKTNLTDGMKVLLAKRLREAQKSAQDNDGVHLRGHVGRGKVQDRDK